MSGKTYTVQTKANQINFFGYTYPRSFVILTINYTNMYLTEEETKHSRNAKLIETLLANDFSNDNFEILIEKQSPNTVIATFTHRDSKETFKTNLGLPVDKGGTIVLAEPDLTFWGTLKNEQAARFHPLELSPENLIWFLNYGLVSISNDDGIDKLNKPEPTGVTHINDITVD